ncbi:hypothetical protein D3C77_703860 [compost metagenome]
MQQATDALRRFHEAEAAGRPAVELALLQAEAERLFQALSEYQLRTIGAPSPTLQ